MMRKGSFLVTLAGAALLAEPAAAGIVLLEDQRYVSLTCIVGGHDLCFGSTHVFDAPANRFGEFRGSVGAMDSGADQFSRIDATTFSGRGGTYTVGGGGAPGESRFQVVFGVDAPSTYSLIGTQHSQHTIYGDIGGGVFDTPDERNASLQVDLVDRFRTQDPEYADTGLLIPGERYLLSVWNRNRGQQFYGGGWQFAFSVASVPEPGGGSAFFALSLAGIAGARLRVRS